MQLAPNIVVAERFRLNRVIGRGGMGSVWHATHLGLDIPCAVKFIEGQYAVVPEAQARFEREAKAAAHLRSPHVVQILDHGVWQGTPYLAMELLEGEDMGQRLNRLGRLHPKDACSIVAQVSRALTKAHAMGIVHRDLKPDNIFLVKDDDREIAKVLDFGIAKLTGTLEGSSTKTGAMLGTPFYMSPEQAQGTRAVDHRSDLWSLGVIVFRAITGQLPFQSDALGDLLMRIILGPIPIPSEVAHSIPPAFDPWWARASNRDPALRFQSAKEMSDALSLALGQSQLTDVMDRSELRELRVAAGAPPSGPAAFATPQPAATTPAVGGAFYGTPQPAQAPPHAFQATPQPIPVPPAPGTTGAPIAHTFGHAPPAPKSKVGLVIAVAAGGLLLCVAAVGGTLATRAMKKSEGASTPTAGAAPTATAPATPTVQTSPTPAPIASASALAPGEAPTQSAPIATTNPSASTPLNPRPIARPGAVKPGAPATAPPQAKKPGDVDLGI